MPVLTSRQMAGLGLALLVGALVTDVAFQQLVNSAGSWGTGRQMVWLTFSVVVRSVSIVGAGLIAGSLVLSALQGRRPSTS